MKESIQKLIDVVESIETDFGNGVNKEGVITTSRLTIALIQAAKDNPMNADFEELLDELSGRLTEVILLAS